MKDGKGLMRIGEVAERLGISIPNAYRLAQRGEIPSVRIGEKAIRFEEDAVEAYIQAHRRGKKGNAA